MGTHSSSADLGTKSSGYLSRGLSVPGFLKAFPDERACLDHLFWLRGGHDMACRLCGQQTKWKRVRPPNYQSRCCFTPLNPLRGTPFYRSSKSLWLWFYALMFGFNLSAFPSAGYLGRHLGIDPTTAFDMRRKIREQIAAICDQAAITSLRGQSVFVQNHRFYKVLSAGGRNRSPTNVFVVSSRESAFAFVVKHRHPSLFRAVLDRLGVDREIYACDNDMDFRRVARKLSTYRVKLIHPSKASSQEGWDCFSKGGALGVYLQSVHKKRYRKSNIETLQANLSEFVLRYNFAHDKGMLFPLFLMSLGRITYSDDQVAAQVLRFRRNVPPRFSR